MKIEKFVLSSMGTNCYLIINEDTKEMVVIDPATSPEYLISHVKNKGYIPKAILLTHGHFDHVMGIDGWVEEFSIPVYLHEDEIKVLEEPRWNLSYMFGTSYSYGEGIGIKDGEVLELAGISLQVIYTPGHTLGGCCYYVEKESVLFSGDTLFCHGVGRTDFPTGDMKTLMKSIREKLFCLPKNVVVYPGHEKETSIGDEQLGT